MIGTKRQKGRTAGGSARIWIGSALTAAMLVQSAWIAPSAVLASGGAVAPSASSTQVAQQQSAIRMISETPITSGASLRTYEYSALRSGSPIKTTVNMVVVDLQNPYVNLSVMNGKNNDMHTKQNVLGMVKETGAVAGTNGDYFHTSSNLPPIGPVIDEGTWLASPLFAQGYYMFGISKSNQPVIDFYTFEGQVTAADGATYPIRGMNRTASWQHGQLSHVDSIFMYTPEWGKLDRGNEPNYTPSEIVIVDGVVEDMLFGETFDFLVPDNAVILRVNRKAAEFFQQHVKIGDKLDLQYDLKPTDATNTVKGQDLKMLIGGHTLLVKDGQPSSYTADVSGIGGARSRTAIGYSKDGRHVYMITADNSGDSKGMTVKELQEFMVMANVWKGMNLDGGGSTQLITRPLGQTEVQLTNKPEFGSMRNVANGIGVYTTAPQGEVKGLKLYGPAFIFMNELATYTATAYDSYYNPMDTTDLPIQWTVSDENEQGDDVQLVPRKRGTATVTATSGSVKQTMTVPVIGKQDVQQIEIESSSQVFAKNKTYTVKAYATTVNGQKRQIPADVIQWELIGFKGSMQGDQLTVLEQDDKATNRLIARYDNFSAMLTVPAGEERLWADFSDLKPEVSFSGYPAEVDGWARIMNGMPGTDLYNNVLHLKYDFYEGGNVTKAAYANLGGDEGMEIEGDPIAMKMKVMGDNSLNWLRAEIVDAAGTLHRVDIAQGINWYGFKEVEVDLSEYNMAYPISLKKLYLANPVERQDEREKFGGIAIDDISFFVRGKLPAIEKPKVELVIDQKSLLVDGEEQVLDQAPVVKNGTTLIPVRFIVDALEGEVAWDPATRKVTLLKNDHLIEMWIGDKDLIIDGQRVTSRVAPELINSRTMVPLRLIADAFGWQVGWNEKEQKVTLQ